MWIPAVWSFLILHNAATQSQMCEEAVLTVVTNVTFPTSASFLDPNHVFYREVMCFTEEEIDREREAAIQFFRGFAGLDFTNTWLANGNTRTRCFLLGDGGFRVQFTGAVMLHGEYGGEEGRLGVAGEGLLYGHDYLYDACTCT